MLSVKDLCSAYKISQSELARKFGIPLRTVQGWYLGERTPPAYVVGMLKRLLELEQQPRSY